MAKGKKIRMTPEMREAIEEQLEAFPKKFHREPGADDPLFFDPDSDSPQPISEAKMAALFQEVVNVARKEANIRPALVYAMQKTGRIVTEDNQHLLSREELAEWNAAIDEYHKLH